MPAVASPKLARVERVELVRTGLWRLSTGEQQFTAADLTSAIAALDCPAIQRPHIKIGHTDPRWDGEPALGWVANFGLANEGNTLVGDLVGMPAWLGEVAASAFPQRSVEGFRNFRCQIGHAHQLVITAVSLLGVTPPGVGTLGSLQDHPSLTAYTQAMYGLAAADNPVPGGEPVTITFPREGPVPDPQPIAAAVDLDDLRDAFYDGAPDNLWITSVQLQPPQLIVTSGMDDDATYRIPYTIGADESVSFGTPVPVEVVYQDAPVDPGEVGPVGVAASAAEPPKRRAVFARPAGDAVAHDHRRRVTTQPFDNGGELLSSWTVATTNTTNAPIPVAAASSPAAEPDSTTQSEEDDVPDLSDIARRLGLPDDAPKEKILAVLDERAGQPAATTKPPADDAPTKPQVSAEPATTEEPAPQQSAAPQPELVAAAAATAAKRDQEFAAAVGQIKTLSQELAQIKAREAAQVKTAFFAAAVQAGKIRPADRQSWEGRYDRDPGLVTEIIGAIAAGSAVPVAVAGYTGNPEADVDDDFEAAVARLDGPYAKKETS